VGYTIGHTITIHKDQFAYIAFPTIAVLDNGEWIIAFKHSVRRQPYIHPPTDPLFRTLVSRTADSGATWAAPTFAPDFDWYGTEDPGIAQVGDGTVILTHFRFHWYPLGLAKKAWRQGAPIALMLPGRHWTEEIVDTDWDNTPLTWARTNDGTYAHLSTDRGHTFDKTVKIGTAPYRAGYTRTGAIQLADGRVAYAVSEHYNPYILHSYLVTSPDYGRTWSAPICITKTEGPRYNEPHIAEVAPGEIFCILRDRLNHHYLFSCRSLDGGKTWSEPQTTPMYGHPGHLLTLRDGRLLCTYGRRIAPFGVRACLSEDGGRTWDIANEIVVRHDFPNSNVGYPQTIEYAPGKLFCAYYGEQPDGTTCVQGTYLELA
jgi:hypothetical protein